MSTGLSVLMRCDGSSEIGLGHIVRCLTLADELRDSFGSRVSFAMRTSELGIGIVSQRGYRVLTPERNIDSEASYTLWLEKAVADSAAKVLILDVRDDLPRQLVQSLRRRGVLIVTIDDPSSRRLDADLAFYPPIPQVLRMDWSSFTGELYADWKWVLLGSEFARPRKRPVNKHPHVMVTMGGSDPACLTLRAINALNQLDDDFDATIVLGKGFRHIEQIEPAIEGASRRYNVCRDATNMADLMSQMDIAVASFGVTAYELAAMGVPAVYICLTQDHAESASAFTDAKIAVSLGVHDQVKDQELAEATKRLLQDVPERRRMAERASQLVDGHGAAEVAAVIARGKKPS